MERWTASGGNHQGKPGRAFKMKTAAVLSFALDSSLEPLDGRWLSGSSVEMAEDPNFGPHHSGLFDFTILFEQSILSLLPTCIFILLVPFRTSVLWKHERVTKPGLLLWLKLVSDSLSWGMPLTL